MKYTIWYDPAFEWSDKWAICINFDNALFVSYQEIRDHIYPYLEQWITSVIPVNCNDILAKKVQTIIGEFNKRD